MSETEQDSEEYLDADLTGHSAEEIAAWNEQAVAEHGELAETDVEPEELEESVVLSEPPDEEGG
jgi:hypothetical protein